MADSKVVASPRKTVTVDLNDGLRRYMFTGAWNGNDVRLVMSSFLREYRLYIRELRRQGIK